MSAWSRAGWKHLKHIAIFTAVVAPALWFAPIPTALLLLCGTLVAEEGDKEIPLSPKDILALGPGEPLVCLSSEGRPELLLVDIWRR